MSLRIGAVLDYENWKHWPKAKEYLSAAHALGDADDDLIRPDHALWVVMDGDELLAACTARITNFGCQVIWVGGHDRKRWLAELDHEIGSAAKRVGATRMIAHGRRGWRKELRRLGWAVHGEVDGMTVYIREL